MGKKFFSQNDDNFNPPACKILAQVERGRMASDLYQKYLRLNVRLERTCDVRLERTFVYVWNVRTAVRTYVSLVNVRLETLFVLYTCAVKARGYKMERTVIRMRTEPRG